MAGFSTGGFSSSGFSAGAASVITTALTRYTAEALGLVPSAPTQIRRAVTETVSLLASAPTRVTRVTAEVVHILPPPSTLTSKVDRIVAETLSLVGLETRVDRVVAETLYVMPPPDHTSTTTRFVIETLQEMGYALPVTNAAIDRAIVEVLGYATEHLGRYVTLTRAVAEVLSTLTKRAKGLMLPSVEVNAVHIAYSVDLELTKAGYWGLTAENGDGYSLSWASASPSTITETWTMAGISASTTFTAPTGRLVRQFEAATGAQAVLLTDLASIHPDGRPGSAVLQELMVWNRALTGPESTRIAAYLTCKWVTVACVPQITAPFPACVS